jgi:hypothetical protein
MLDAAGGVYCEGQGAGGEPIDGALDTVRGRRAIVTKQLAGLLYLLSLSPAGCITLRAKLCYLSSTGKLPLCAGASFCLRAD